ncbi:MAG: tetratricopeptide repeat protein [Polyangiales bacterium]
MGPRSARLPLCAAVAAALVSGMGPGRRAAAQDLASANKQLVSIESAVAVLNKAPLRGSELRSATYVEERLTDGELFFRLHDYVRASIILTDIVERYPRHTAYPDALFLLAESLFHASDYLGARTRYRELLDHADEAAFRPRLQGSLARLIEIAIRIRDFNGIEHYFDRLARLPPSAVEAATAYFKAKYLYSVAVPTDVFGATPEPGQAATQPSAPQIDQDRLEQARIAFGEVKEGSQYSPQAHYFIGVIYTLRGQYDAAIEAFKRVVSIKPADDTQREVVELALLSLGRLYYETNQETFAIEAYQSIPRTSKRFETALFEIAWTYLRQGDSTHAERSLEVLGVAAPESQYIPDAKILRGNLLLRDGRYAAAGEVFNEVTRDFQPVRDQLDKLLAQQSDVPEYFRSLVRHNIDQFDDEAFLPPLALRWAKIEGDMRRAVDAVRDLSTARRLTGETTDVVTRLTAALSVRNRVNMFPDLRAQREEATAIRNRLARVRKELIVAQDAQTDRLDSPELTRVQGERRELERSLAALPVKGSDFERRHAGADDRFLALDKQLSSLDVQLLGIDARIVATERFITDSIHTPEQRAGVEAYRNELSQHRVAVGGYRQQLVALKQELETARLQVGIGDATYSRDDELRKQYSELVARERQLIAAAGGRVNPQLDRMFQRVNALEATVDERDRGIDRVVDERANDMQRVLTEEGGKLAGYRTSLAALNTQTEDVVGGLSYANYRQVQHRFYDLVLKADVGVVDVGWAEREEHRARIETLTRERARSAQALDDEFREIMDDRSKP